MTSASSPFEVGPYLIMATGFVVAYHLSGRNLAMTITLNFDHLSDMPQQIL
jgi:hypothetical protein